MLTDYGNKPEAENAPTCRHRWGFVCWFLDPKLRAESSRDFRHLIERCRRCQHVRITLWIDETATGSDYADSLEEALLGRAYTLRADSIVKN